MVDVVQTDDAIQFTWTNGAGVLQSVTLREHAACTLTHYSESTRYSAAHYLYRFGTGAARRDVFCHQSRDGYGEIVFVADNGDRTPTTVHFGHSPHYGTLLEYFEARARATMGDAAYLAVIAKGKRH